jgi:hypothetical protein
VFFFCFCCFCEKKTAGEAMASSSAVDMDAGAMAAEKWPRLGWGRRVAALVASVLCFGALCFCVLASPAGRVFCVFVFGLARLRAECFVFLCFGAPAGSMGHAGYVHVHVSLGFIQGVRRRAWMRAERTTPWAPWQLPLSCLRCLGRCLRCHRSHSRC